jgi:hypothetical protein
MILQTCISLKIFLWALSNFQFYKKHYCSQTDSSTFMRIGYEENSVRPHHDFRAAVPGPNRVGFHLYLIYLKQEIEPTLGKQSFMNTQWQLTNSGYIYFSNNESHILK